MNNIELDIERFKQLKLSAVNRDFDSYLDKKAEELGGMKRPRSLSPSTIGLLKQLLQSIKGERENVKSN